MNTLSSFYAYLKTVNYAYLLILGLVVKAIAFDVSYASFLLTIPVLGFEAYKIYIKHKTPDPIKLNEELQRDIDNIKSKMNAQTMEKNVVPPTAKRFF